MFDRIVYWLQWITAEAYNALIQAITRSAAPVAEARGSVSNLIDGALVTALIALPAVVAALVVLKTRHRFAEAHGASAARGWTFTMLAYAAGWTGLVYAVMEAEAAKGAWTSAALTPALLWPIGLLAMAVATYGPLGAHRIVRKASPRR